MLRLGVSFWDAFLRQPNAFSHVFFEQLLSGELPASAAAQLATEAVLASYDPGMSLPNSICALQNLNTLDFVARIAERAEINLNLVKRRVSIWLDSPDSIIDAAFEESYGYCWARCWVGCDVKYIRHTYKNCALYEQTQNRTENVAILHRTLEYVQSHMNTPEWANLADDIVVHYLSHAAEFAPEKQRIYVNFMISAMQNSTIATKNAGDVVRFVAQIMDNIREFYRAARDDPSLLTERAGFLL